MPELAAVITIRSGTQANIAADFNRAKPKSAQDVNGLGKSAFWNPEALGLLGKKQGSLSVLSEDKIIIVSGDNLSIETARKIIDLVWTNYMKYTTKLNKKGHYHRADDCYDGLQRCPFNYQHGCNRDRQSLL